MANEFFNRSGTPSTGAALASSAIRAEFLLIEQGFDKLPDLTGNGGEVVIVNAGETALETVATTGTGSVVRATSATLVTPTLGVATATSVNKVAITAPAASATLTIADGKTLTASNTLTLAGTDGTTLNINAVTNLNAGTYTPTNSNNSAFVTSVTPGLCSWARLGSFLIIGGVFDVVVGDELSEQTIGMSLPNSFTVSTGAGSVVTGVVEDSTFPTTKLPLYGSTPPAASRFNIKYRTIGATVSGKAYFQAVLLLA